MARKRIYRVVHRKHVDNIFSGEGGLHAAGRWSSSGRLVCYAADSLALATLELVVQSGHLKRLRELVYAIAQVDESAILNASLEELPNEWNRHPPRRPSRDYGDTWLESRTTIALRLPSVLMPESYTYVLNPTHPDYQEELDVIGVHPLKLDKRILGRFRNA